MKPSTRNWIIAAIAVALIAVGIYFYFRSKKNQELIDKTIDPVKKFSSDKNIPRGVRNNNPGNIRISNNDWKGKIPKAENSDGAFEQFMELKFGVRAMIVLIRNWIKKGTANTLRKVVSRYAPSNENNTAGYIDSVSKMTGIDPDAILDIDKATLNKIVLAMATKEVGQGHVKQSDFDEAWKIA